MPVVLPVPKPLDGKPRDEKGKGKKGKECGKGKGKGSGKAPRVERTKCWSWPPPREAEPLAALPVALFMAPPAAETIIYDTARRSYAFHWRRAFPEDAAEWAFKQLLEEVPWDELKNKRGVVTRKSCWVSGMGSHAEKCSCGYAYGENSMAPKAVPFLERLTEVLFSNLFPDLPASMRPTCANLNLYDNGEQSCGWHADDERLFGDPESDDVTIVSLSLGAPREFWLALRRKPGDVTPNEKSVMEIDLGHGDLMTMEGLCQKYTLHMVPRADHGRGAGTRINVTWRWIRQHQEGCALAVQNQKGIQRGSATFLEPKPFYPNWCAGREVRWGVCSYCEHPGFKGGRALVDCGDMGWLCRLCKEGAEAEVANAWAWQWSQWQAPLAPAVC